MSVSRVTLRDLQEALARLDGERASISARIEEIDAQAAALHTTHKYMMSLYEEDQAEIAASPPPPPSKNLRNEMVAILREVNQPMHYKVLREQLESRGFVINGARKDNTVGAHLSNDTRFRNVGRGLWGLASWGSSTEGRDESGDDESGDKPLEAEEPPNESSHSQETRSEPDSARAIPDAASIPPSRVFYTADLLKGADSQLHRPPSVFSSTSR